ncbi:uncharacterized protein [Antennarius striatus]|uniref:uncharacterized protein n=1 Tax=Antennarius striatus TaxID=241820 RepID=UPI0035ADB0FB
MGGKSSKKAKLKERTKIDPPVRKEVKPAPPVIDHDRVGNPSDDEDIPDYTNYRYSDSDDSYEGSVDEEEKCYDPRDPTLTFVDGQDDMDFLCNEYKSLRAKMSCGHSVTPMSLTDWCLQQVDQGEFRFVCGQTGCDVEWPFEEVCKMALLTPEEIEYFEKKIFQNTATCRMEIKVCPGCNSNVTRQDLNNLNVHCNVCTAAKGRVYRFCWQCLREWKGDGSSSVRCQNVGCQNPLDILKACPELVFEDVEEVMGCPSIRACPTCGLLVSHSSKQCKTITCKRCNVKFCFVCLGFSKDCLEKRPYGACPSGVAARQTSIPVWKKK